ncbi:MAG: hypothetical protein JWP82_2197, partial [Humibacillus sp.]|nr:hypothetical protein [Humibacillus sp.]
MLSPVGLQGKPARVTAIGRSPGGGAVSGPEGPAARVGPEAAEVDGGDGGDATAAEEATGGGDAFGATCVVLGVPGSGDGSWPATEVKRVDRP